MVAVKHYLWTDNEHFQQATRDATPVMGEAVQNLTLLLHEALQNERKRVAATGGTEQKSVHKNSGNPKNLRLIPMSAALYAHRR